jgi:hypothetical protein
MAGSLVLAKMSFQDDATGGVSMLRSRGVDPGELARILARLPREEVNERILNFSSKTRLDFTDDFLSNLTTEQLRHILLSAMLYLRPR